MDWVVNCLRVTHLIECCVSYLDTTPSVSKNLFHHAGLLLLLHLVFLRMMTKEVDVVRTAIAK